MIDPLALRVAARYKQKKKVESEDGGETTVYLYSDRQVARRNAEKAKRLEGLSKGIGELRKKVKRDLKSSDPDRCLTALAVALIDHTFERVGNDESVKEREHFGVTGWQRRHVSFGRGHATIKYTGKSGVQQTKKVTDKSILKALRNAYEASDGDDAGIFEHSGGKVTAEKVNAYLEPFDITAKDIRGFHANSEMQTRLKAIRGKGGTLPTDKKECKAKLKEEFKQALEETAEAVGHEASTLKSQYLVPGLEDDYLKDGNVESTFIKTAAWPFYPDAIPDDPAERVTERWWREAHAKLRVAMSMTEAKAILGFPPTAEPSPVEVNKAWRQKAFENHPDRGGDPVKMVEINVAKDILEGKERPSGEGRSTPSPSRAPYRYEPPKKEETTFDEAKGKANIPAGVDWVFVTDRQRGVGYSSDEFERSDTSWCAYGRTESKHVFVGIRHLYYRQYVVGVTTPDLDQWTIESVEYPIKGDEGTTPAWLYAGVVKALKWAGFRGKFNSKVVDARGWTFSEKFPHGATTSIKNFLADTGAVAADDPRVQGRKLVIELQYIGGYQQDVSLNILVNGRATELSKSDMQLVSKTRLIGVVFGDYPYGGVKKNVTRMRKGKEILTWLAEKLQSIPPEVRTALQTAAAQMR